MRHRRKTAVLMAAVTLSMSVASPVRAAAPRVQVDETMYVNMDYYGNMTTVNVVKGCSTNGVERYTDYGVYDKVVNMTDKTEPELGDLAASGGQQTVLLPVYDAGRHDRASVDI